MPAAPASGPTSVPRPRPWGGGSPAGVTVWPARVPGQAAAHAACRQLPLRGGCLWAAPAHSLLVLPPVPLGPHGGRKAIMSRDRQGFWKLPGWGEGSLMSGASPRIHVVGDREGPGWSQPPHPAPPKLLSCPHGPGSRNMWGPLCLSPSPVPYQGFLLLALPPAGPWAWGSRPVRLGAGRHQPGCYTSPSETVLGPADLGRGGGGVSGTGWGGASEKGAPAPPPLSPPQDPTSCSLKGIVSVRPSQCCGRVCVPRTV